MKVAERSSDHDRADQWRNGAVLEVACPICIALPGEQCMPASLTGPHWARLELACGEGR